MEQGSRIRRLPPAANQERQLIERRILVEARDLAEREGDAAALVLASPSWHPGLIGIVASRLVDQFARPVLMIALREGKNRHSERWYRLFNEAPALLLIAIVVLAVVKPF